MYGAETWTTREKELRLLGKTEMKMSRWIMGITLRDHKRNVDIRKKLGVIDIREKVKETRLRWFGHVKRSNSYIRTVYEKPVEGKRSRGRQKMRWRDCVKKDLQEKGLKESDALDRKMWRRKINVADPAPERD